MADEVRTSGTGRPLRRLIGAAGPDRGRIGLAVVCSVLNKLLDLAPPVLIGTAIDVVVAREESFLASLGATSVTAQLWILAAATLVIWTGESLFEYLHAILWRGVAQSVQHRLRLRAFRAVADLEIATLQRRSTGSLMSVLNDDVNQLERFLDGGANALIQVATTVVLVGVLFFAASPQVAIFAMAPMPFIVWGSIAFQRRLTPRYAEVRERVGDLNARLAAALGGMATVQGYTAEDHEAAELERLSAEYLQDNRRAIALSSAFSPLIRLVIVLGFTATLVYGGWLVLEDRLDAAVYAVLVFMTQRLLWPLTSLGATLDLYQRAMASTTRILDLADARPAITGGPRTLPPDAPGHVRFDDVSFAYVAGHPVLRDVTIDFPAGRTTAIVGATGGGKTTVVRLLLRFHESDDAGTPRTGRITIDDTEIRDLELASLRRAIAVVSQDVFLFPGTVRENVAYGRLGAAPDAPAPTDHELAAAARAAEALEFIERLPHGWDTVVGERGVKLSGGQRQRLAMARAILKDAPILVLDEATSSVDNETEAAIQRSLARVSADRTTIVIAHRLSTVRRADRIHVLVDGRVAESGRHDALLARGGVYADLWRVQTGEASELASPVRDAADD